MIEDGSLRQVNELAQLPLISHPGASCQPLLGYDWEWAKIIKLCHISFQHDPWRRWHRIGFILGSMDDSFICRMKCIYNSDIFHSHCLVSECTKLAPLSLRFSTFPMIFCFYLFRSLLTWPNLCLCWEGTHYSYGYSAVPRIQQCIQVSVLWEMGGWNLCYLSLALVLRNASMFWMPFSFIFWKLVRCRNQVHAVSPAEVIAWWSSLAT